MPYNQDKKLLAPVLDRLLEQNRNSDFKQPHQILKHLRESVRRDLEFLFNSRYRCMSGPAGLTHLEHSNINFGLPDLSTVNMTSVDSRRAFCKKIEKSIIAYEPRIKSVQVKSEDTLDNEDPSIRFRVEAILHSNPVAEMIIFDSAINPINQTVDVSEIM